MKVRDYLRSHEACLRPEGRHTRVCVNGMDILIRSLPQITIRKLLNEAVAIMLLRLQKNLLESKLRFEQRTLEQVSLRIALHNLYLYMKWDEYLPKYCGDPHPLEASDLLMYQVADQVLLFCQKVYAGDFKARAMALLGLSVQEFRRWEAQRLQSRMRADNPFYRVA
ncbi:hypothetical protein D3C78_527500 [compost metagenome]